jgi:cytochrome c-type biogenesis protein
MKELLRYVNRAAGALLVVTGTYIAYYGWYEIRDGGATSDPFVDRVAGWSSGVAELVHDLGAQTVAVVLGLLVVLALLFAARRSDRTRDDAPTG